MLVSASTIALHTGQTLFVYSRNTSSRSTRTRSLNAVIVDLQWGGALPTDVRWPAHQHTSARFAERHEMGRSDLDPDDRSAVASQHEVQRRTRAHHRVHRRGDSVGLPQI